MNTNETYTKEIAGDNPKHTIKVKGKITNSSSSFHSDCGFGSSLEIGRELVGNWSEIACFYP
jgi:hypothetical protein